MFDRVKRLFAATAALLAVATTANSADQIHLRVAFSNHPKLYKELAVEFMRQNKDVVVDLLPPSVNYDHLLQTLLRGNITNELPDVAFPSISQMARLAEKGIVQRLDSSIAAEPDWSSLGYAQSLVEACRVGNSTYCLPFAIAVPILYYNADIVKQAGGDPDNFPAAWEEILDLANQIKRNATGRQGIYFSYFTHSSNWTTTALINSRGGRLLTPDGKDIAFDSPEGMWSLQLMRKFGEAGQVDMSLDQARQAFAAGTLGILSTSSSDLAILEKQVGNKFTMKTAIWPLEKPSGRLPAGGNGVALTTKDPGKRAAGWKFIKFVTGPYGQTVMVKESGYTPVNTLAVEDPSLGESFKKDANQRTAASQVPVITRWEAFPGENGLKASDTYRDYVQQVATLKRTPEEVMPDLVRKVRSLIAKRTGE